MRFYVLDSPEPGSPEDRTAGTEFSAAKGFETGDAPRCPQCGDYIGLLEWLPPFRVEIRTFGTRFGDLAFDGVWPYLLVSQRFLVLYEEHGLKGLSGFEPVAVTKVKRRRKVIGDLPAYVRAVVTRSQAEIDYAASGYEWRDSPPTCATCRIGGYRRRAGLVVDPATWPGEDIFIARAAAEFIVSERFKRFCEEFAIKNAVLKPAETCAREWP
jgi:hypothetical protein